MLKTALIMAGGKGERFWPKSRQSLPKQFLSLTGDGKTMLQLTVERISDQISLKDTYVVTNEKYKSIVTQQLPELPIRNIICEPEGRNTAPCIGLGSATISLRYPNEDPVITVLPADHMVKDIESFRECLNSACEVAYERQCIVTIGIRPEYPETGYGYIKYDKDSGENGIYKVSTFVEKPDRETAKVYLERGDYLWNSGMFIWSLSSIRDAYKKFLPDTYDKLVTIKDLAKTCDDKGIDMVFSSMESESVDYGIMEKADNIFIIPGDFGWDDVGSWPALKRINDTDTAGNFISGNVASLDNSGCIIDSSSGKLVAAFGLNDIIIVDTDDVLLVTDKNHSANIKELVASIKEQNKEKYL